MSAPLDRIEGIQGMHDMAALLKAFNDGLRDEGFNQRDALRLTAAYITGLAQQVPRD